MNSTKKSLTFPNGRPEPLLLKKEQSVSSRETSSAHVITNTGHAGPDLTAENKEKDKRAAELIIANKELAYQNAEKEKRAAELVTANKELVTQIRENEKRAAELLIAYRELALHHQNTELNKRKAEFIGIASHELKTPLTSVSAYLQFLERRLVGEANRQYVEKALRQVEKLEGLISDLMDVSKIEAGKMCLKYGTFDISEVTNEAIELINLGMQTHVIECAFPVEQILVEADRQRIEQVVINLLSNAIKYSPNADRIKVTVSQTVSEVVVSVQDFGLGIKEDEQSHVFSRFFRAEGLSQNISGLGIGLYICDDIISRHKGTLSVDSQLGEGSTFTFTLPKSN